MTIAGTNDLTFLVTDISGSPIVGLSLVDFEINGQVGSTIINQGTITPSMSADGYYFLEATLPVGQGFLEVTSVSPGYFVTPTFFDIDAGVYSVDEVYASLARNSNDLTSVSIGVYETQDIGPFKEGDSWDFSYTVPDSIATNISGFSDFKASLFTGAALTSAISAAPGYIGDFTLTVDVPSKIIRFIMPYALTTGIIDEGELEDTFYSDLQCMDGTLRKTLAEFSILCRRQFTKG